MLAYFSAMAPLSFKQALFPLPPVFDTKRQTAIMTLEARDSELRKTLESTNSVLRQKAEELSHTNIKIEEKLVARKAMKQELDKKKSVQQTPPEFRSGEHIFTWGKCATQQIVLNSPSEKSRVNSVTHNCKLDCNKPNLSFAQQFEACIVNKASENLPKVISDTWNWFAQVWLEYDGTEFFHKEILLLNTRMKILETELSCLGTESHNLCDELHALDKDICTALEDIHCLRRLLQNKTFTAKELEILSQVCPFDHMDSLSSLVMLSDNTLHENISDQDTASLPNEIAPPSVLPEAVDGTTSPQAPICDSYNQNDACSRQLDETRVLYNDTDAHISQTKVTVEQLSAVPESTVDFIPKNTDCMSHILFVGGTGAGKSSLGNYLHDLGQNKRVFEPAEDGCKASKTQHTSHSVICIKNSYSCNGTQFAFIDTPGLNESTDKDITHMQELLSEVQALKYVNVLVLVIPYNFKLDIQLVQTMKFYRELFMPLFVAGNVCIVLTHMSEDDLDREQADSETNVKQNHLKCCNEALGLQISYSISLC